MAPMLEHNDPDTTSSPTTSTLSWQSAFWAIFSLAITTASQDTGFVLGLPPSYRALLRFSPAICLVDSVDILLQILRYIPQAGVCGDVRCTATQRGIDHREASRKMTASTLAIVCFTFLSAKEAVKLFSCHGIPWTQVLAGVYVFAFAVQGLLNVVGPEREYASSSETTTRRTSRLGLGTPTPRTSFRAPGDRDIIILTWCAGVLQILILMAAVWFPVPQPRTSVGWLASAWAYLYSAIAVADAPMLEDGRIDMFYLMYWPFVACVTIVFDWFIGRSYWIPGALSFLRAPRQSPRKASKVRLVRECVLWLARCSLYCQALACFSLAIPAVLIPALLMARRATPALAGSLHARTLASSGALFLALSSCHAVSRVVVGCSKRLGWAEGGKTSVLCTTLLLANLLCGLIYYSNLYSAEGTYKPAWTDKLG